MPLAISNRTKVATRFGDVQIATAGGGPVQLANRECPWGAVTATTGRPGLGVALIRRLDVRVADEIPSDFDDRPSRIGRQPLDDGRLTDEIRTLHDDDHRPQACTADGVPQHNPAPKCRSGTPRTCAHNSA